MSAEEARAVIERLEHLLRRGGRADPSAEREIRRLLYLLEGAPVPRAAAALVVLRLRGLLAVLFTADKHESYPGGATALRARIVDHLAALRTLLEPPQSPGEQSRKPPSSQEPGTSHQQRPPHTDSADRSPP